MKYITICHWGKHQHYKDRRPKWIKLEIEIIEEFDADGNFKKFYPMPDSAKLTFICLLCFRANFNEKIPYRDDKWLAKQLGIETVDLQPLVNAGYIKIDTESVSEPYQVGTKLDGKNTPETETETEIEIASKRSGGKTPAVPLKKLPKIGSKHFEAKLKNAADIKCLCEKIKRNGFNPFQFVQKCCNQNKHPSAIFEALEALLDPKLEVQNPYPYAMAIIKTKSQNYHEAEHVKQSQEFKVAWGKEFFE